ncbi:hypothetical protein [Mesorhizobium sp. WSM3862]|uniref:hypothetical protein n=1 Tax=Mesorhizobium sp. WSM3862 TaxID=632858 RepID=UPI000BB03DCA|nr:hypothetical protein [Mesorhizobium sp. WSM3862]PBB96803.1 hypothetical protein CK224_21275 [Mesorhizobium sp. WSM3862]
MRGLSKRKGSEVWQGKFRIPQRLWDRRDDLLKLGASGIGGSQEFTKSLGERDRSQATRVYRERLDAWERLLEAWQALLDHGPQSLSQMDAVRVAALGAARRWEAFKDNPLDAPVAAHGSFSRPVFVPSDTTRIHLAALSPEAREAARLEGIASARRLLDGGPIERAKALQDVRDGTGFPWCFPEFRAVGLAMMEDARGSAISEDLGAAGITAADEWSRFLVGLEGMGAKGRLAASLEARLSGDLSEPAWVADAKQAAPPSSGPKGASAKGVTFEAIIDAQVTKKKAGQGSKPMPDKSVKKYKRIAEAFAAHRNSKNAATVTVREVEAWLDSMQEEAGVSNRTIADRLVAIGTIINWGKKQRDHRDAMAQAETISGQVELPSYMEKPADETSYTMEEARTVLLAARREEDASKRWLPWLCLYAGLRISEANTLRKSDFFQAEGLWFFKVTSAGKRSLKTANSERRIPVHPALQAEGFLVWVEAAPEGQLFRDGATSLIGRWVRSKAVGLVRPGLSPNHGLRHLFVGLSRRYGLEGSAAEYLAGHSTQAVHAKYGSSDVMLPGLAAEIRKIDPLLGNVSMKLYEESNDGS